MQNFNTLDHILVIINWANIAFYLKYRYTWEGSTFTKGVFLTSKDEWNGMRPKSSVVTQAILTYIWWVWGAVRAEIAEAQLNLHLIPIKSIRVSLQG